MIRINMFHRDKKFELVPNANKRSKYKMNLKEPSQNSLIKVR